MDSLALGQYFNQVHGQPSRLGHLDCVRFVIEALRIGWRRDYRHLLGYRDRRSAVARLRAAGGLEEAFTEVFGETVGACELEPGDIAYFNQPAVGLVMPGYVAMKYRRTIVRVSPEFVYRGWHGAGT